MTDANRVRARIEPWVRREVESSDLDEFRSRAGPAGSFGVCDVVQSMDAFGEPAR
jgi:hypothetical protein